MPANCKNCKCVTQRLKDDNLCYYCAGERGRRLIYGIDFASKVDYTAVVVHDLPLPMPDENNFPRLKLVRKISQTKYTKILQLIQDLLVSAPPFYIVTDYAAEKSISDALEEQFGKARFEGVNTNVLAVKLMLKEDGIAILNSAEYIYPNPASVFGADRELLAELMQQLQNEQMMRTRTGKKITFDHPQGEHNDLAIAWELSIHGCRKYMLNKTGPVAAYSKKTEPSKYAYVNDDEDLFPELKKSGITINHIIRHDPA